MNTKTISFFFAFLFGLIITGKSSGKIRKSSRIVIIWTIATMSLINVEAKSSSGLPGAGGFTPQAYSCPVNRYINKDSGLFNKLEFQNSGSDKPGGNGGSSDNNNSNVESGCTENPQSDNFHYYCHEPIN